jgi:putative ABC transport system permease protein
LGRRWLDWVGPGPADTQLRSIYILVTAPDKVASVADAAYLLLAPTDPSSVGIQTSETLAQVRAAVQGELGRYGRNLVTLVLAAGLVLTGLNVYGTVTTRRRDFGRRRALGATRPTIIGLIATQTALTALIGATAGTGATWLILTKTTGTPPDPTFTLAIGVLAILTTTIAAIPPATIAAYRDPVRILRVP